MRHLLEILDERGLEYTQVGELYRLLCPFHGDTNKPNLFVYPDTNSYYCYACQEGGSPVDFILKYDGCTLREALKEASVKEPEIRLRLHNRIHNKENLQDKDFKKQVNMRISKLLCEGFKKKDPKKVFELMKQLDKRLISEKPILYDESKRMVVYFKKQMEVKCNEGV